MHARELVELAAAVAAHGPVLVRQPRQLSTAGIEQYWTASKCRLDSWSRSLKQFTTSADSTGARRRPAVRGVIEEIITGEVLARVWTAVMCAFDRRHGTESAGPVARSVFVGHLEARNRVLTLLVHRPGIKAEAAMKLDRLRRRTERWSDLLIGYLTGLDDVVEFAVEPARARDFAEDLHYRAEKGVRYILPERPEGCFAQNVPDPFFPMVMASLRASFRKGLSPRSPNANLNRQIATAILSCFNGELFDSTDMFHSLWLTRLTNTADDVQGMVDELLEARG